MAKTAEELAEFFTRIQERHGELPLSALYEVYREGMEDGLNAMGPTYAPVYQAKHARTEDVDYTEGA